jgi:CheY-like chemotaxis protein
MMLQPEQPARRCILVIEDDPAVGEMLTTVLEIEGYQTAWVDSGLEAINVLTGVGEAEPMRQDRSPSRAPALCRPPDLLLLDLQLPTMDGAQMVRHLNHLRQAVPPIIVVSAKRREAVDAAAEAIGAVAVLYKPFQIEDLLDQIKSILASPDDAPPSQDAARQSTT